jgi:diguanylate cyclase (GGDEF)-like protein
MSGIPPQRRLSLPPYSDHDDETGLLTDNAFRAAVSDCTCLAETLEGRTSLAVLSIHLDRVTELEQARGPDILDGLVAAAAERLNGCVRGSDLISRTGHAHFRILLQPLHSPELAASIAEKICRTLSIPFTVQRTRLHMSASVGIGLFPHDSDDAGLLIERADNALKHALSLGDCFQFDDHGLSTSLGQLAESDDDPRDALYNGEFEVYYQPQVDLQSGRVCSAEALIRWHHPLRGLVPPNEFIPLAESTGLIHELGAWVLDQACQQAVAWQTLSDDEIAISVNVSGRQLDHPDFPELVDQILERTGLPPRLLQLEITESTIMRRPDDVAQILHRVRKSGVTIALDDFGTGHSSLAYLRHFPLDTLKIDRSFILDLSGPDQNVVLLRSIVDLAHALGLNVVAEGVETAAQLAVLQAHECDEIQGFLIAPAVTAGEFNRRFLTQCYKIPLSGIIKPLKLNGIN